MHVAEATQTVATEHNGWTNRETWMVNLWLTNDESCYEALYSILKDFDHYDQPYDIQQYIHWIIDTVDTTMTSDLLETCLRRLNWQEIAENNR